MVIRLFVLNGFIHNNGCMNYVLLVAQDLVHQPYHLDSALPSKSPSLR